MHTDEEIDDTVNQRLFDHLMTIEKYRQEKFEEEVREGRRIFVFLIVFFSLLFLGDFLYHHIWPEVEVDNITEGALDGMRK